MISHKIENIIIHCSDSEWGCEKVINKWHTDPKPQGRGWKGTGYNGIICNGHKQYKSDYVMEDDGLFEEGRALDFNAYITQDEKAAHTLGYNHNSIGICLIGKNQFTVKQFYTLFNFCKVFQAINPKIKIKGHYEMSTARGKTCPNFDVLAFTAILKNNEYKTAVYDDIALNMPVKREGFIV